jgi:hypothetical protein
MKIGLDWHEGRGYADAFGKRASYTVERNGNSKPHVVKGEWVVEIYQGTSRLPTIIQGGFKTRRQAQAWCLLFEHDEGRDV